MLRNVLKKREFRLQLVKALRRENSNGRATSSVIAITIWSMGGRECYHCKQWIEDGEEHDCWTTH